MPAVEMLMKEYVTQGGNPEQCRESLIKEFTPMIKYHASRLAARVPANLDAEDLFSVGAMALVDALDRYDPGRDTKLKTYTEHRIRGAMLDEIRSMDWIPRSVRDRMATLKKATRTVEQRLGRSAMQSEIGAALGLLPDGMAGFLAKAQPPSIFSLDEVYSDDGDRKQVFEPTLKSTWPNQLEVMIGEDKRRLLARSIEELPEKERLSLRLYYYENLTMKEIGNRLLVSESRVSQLRRQAVIHLKALLVRDSYNG